jgi:putative transposase
LVLEYQLSLAQISSWKSEFLSNASFVFGSKRTRSETKNEITDALFSQIGQLKAENECLKNKVEKIPVKERRQWIEPENCELSISGQCSAAKVSRSSIYYEKVQVSKSDDALMVAIKDIYLQDCTFGTRSYVAKLNELGFKVGRDKVRSLLRKMGIGLVDPMPSTT